MCHEVLSKPRKRVPRLRNIRRAAWLKKNRREVESFASMAALTEYETKPCTMPGCDDTMVLTMRGISVGGTTPRPGWLCGKNPEHVEWVFGMECGRWPHERHRLSAVRVKGR